MLAYVLKRLAMTALVLLVVMTFLAALVHLIPGDPVTTILGPRADPELSKIVRDQMQLDLPVPEQIWNFVTGALHGDLGVDFVSDEDVTSLVFSALPHTIVLAVSSLVLAIGVGVPLGVYAATHPNTWLDRVMGVISVSFITDAVLRRSALAAPDLLRASPLAARDRQRATSRTRSTTLRHLILPAIALGLAWIGYFARLVRASMLEVLNTNYIRTAHAFGIRERDDLLPVRAQERDHPDDRRARRRARHAHGRCDLRRGDLRPARARHADLRLHRVAQLPGRARRCPRGRDPVRDLQPARRPLLPLPRPAHPRGAGTSDGRPHRGPAGPHPARRRMGARLALVREVARRPAGAFGLVVVASLLVAALFPGVLAPVRPRRAGHPVAPPGPVARPPARHGRARPRPPLAGDLQLPRSSSASPFPPCSSRSSRDSCSACSPATWAAGSTMR